VFVALKPEMNATNKYIQQHGVDGYV